MVTVSQYVKKTISVIAVLSVFSLAVTQVFAVPPTTKYLPGQELDPNCGPTDTNCSVSVAWDQNLDDNYIYSIGKLIGIGTASPTESLDIASGLLRLRDYPSTRDDTSITTDYSLGSTTNTVNNGSADDVVFGGTYTGDIAETFNVTITSTGGLTLGSTTNTINNGSTDDINFVGTYSGVDAGDFRIDIGKSGGYTWVAPSGASASGTISIGTQFLADGVSVTFGSASYTQGDRWVATVSAPPSTEFDWSDENGHSGTGVSIVTGTPISLASGVSVEFGSSEYFAGEQWEASTSNSVIAQDPENFLFTNVDGVVQSAPITALSDLLGGGTSYTSQNGITLTGSVFGLGGTLTGNTLINGSGSHFNFILGDSTQLGEFSAYSADTIFDAQDSLSLSAVNEILFKTPAINASTATNGQVLTLVDALTGEVEFQNASGGGGTYQLYAENPTSGMTPTATGSNAIAIGGGTSSGYGTISIGLATASQSSFLGRAIAIGYAGSASGNNAVSIGVNATASGDQSVAIGNGATSSGTNSYSIGSNSTISGNASIGIGSRISAPSGSEMAIGIANTGYTPVSTSAVDPADRLFVIGNGDAFGVTPSDAFTILKNGQTGIGIDNFEAATTGELLQVGDTSVVDAVARFTNSTGFCTINPTTTTLSCTSDQRLKDNIDSIDNSESLKKIQGLRPVTYVWKGDPDQVRQIGFIAQEVEQVIPELVTIDQKTGLRTLATTGMVPVLVGAVQELSFRMSALDLVTGVDTAAMVSVIKDMVTETLKTMENIVVTTITAGTATIKDITASLIKTDEIQSQKLCLGQTCITESELIQMLQNRPSVPVSADTIQTTRPDDTGAVVTPITDPVPDTVPIAADPIIIEPVTIDPAAADSSVTIPANPISAE